MEKSSSVMQYSYRQLAEQLVLEIKSARYAAGERLPSVRQLAVTHRVSVATVMRCYRYLEQIGLIEARSKSGMYVADWKQAMLNQKLSQSDAISITSENSANSAPVIEYEKLVSLEYRMAQLYSLTAQTPELGLHLASAVSEWYPVEALAKIGQKQLRNHHSFLGAYPTGSGLPELKTALVGFMAGFGVDLQAEDLLITNGSTEALSVALRAVTKPGDAVIVESPVYFGLLQMIESLGLKALEVPCTHASGISIEALEYALEHQNGVRAMVLMPNFQNPLGCCMPVSHKKRILKLAETYDIAIIEDDVFGDLTPMAERPLPIKAWDRQGAQGRVMYTGSCSKSMAPGLRIGWIAGGRYQAKVASLKLSYSLVTPLLEQAILAEFIQSGALPLHLRKLRERLHANIPLVLSAVKTHFPAQCQVVSTAGGWWLWLALPPGIDSLELLRASVKCGIAFTPGSMFSNSGKYSNHIRINIARPWDSAMQRGFETLGELLRKNNE